MKTFTRSCHIAILLCLPAAIGAQTSDARAAVLVRAMARALRTTAYLPGLSIAIGRGERIILAEGFGFADVDHKRPITPATRFRTASVGKAITATAVGKLVQEGRLNLDASVKEYVPAFPDKQWPITPRQLAGHIAGMPHYNSADKTERRFYNSLDDALGVFAAESLLFEPGTRYSYSTHGFTLLSAVIERAAGVPFLQYMRDQVFMPLHMSSTGPHLIASPGAAMATLYTIKDKEPVRVPDPEDPSYKWAGGGFVSTPTDLIRLAAGYSNGFLKPETVSMMFASQRLRSGAETGVGIAWRNSFDVSGNRVVEHAGSMEGTRTVITMYPESRLAVAIMTNTDWSSLVEETAHMLALPYLGKRAPIKQPVATLDVAVTILRVGGGKDSKAGALVLHKGGGQLVVDAGSATEVTYPLIYLERGNIYAMIRPDGIVYLTVEVNGRVVTGKALAYGSPRLTSPTNNPPFFTFEGTLPK